MNFDFNLINFHLDRLRSIYKVCGTEFNTNLRSDPNYHGSTKKKKILTTMTPLKGFIYR